MLEWLLISLLPTPMDIKVRSFVVKQIANNGRTDDVLLAPQNHFMCSVYTTDSHVCNPNYKSSWLTMVQNDLKGTNIVFN